METVPKPPELLALHDVTGELFATLKDWFEVPDLVGLDLSDIDSAVTQLGDPVAVAALAMRKLQALRLLAQPGVRTSTDVVVTIVQDLDRALIQAPTMHLRRAASTTDWDAELEQLLDVGGDPPDIATDPPGAAGSPTDADPPEVVRFRELHGSLHLAVRAVVDASDGELRYLV